MSEKYYTFAGWVVGSMFNGGPVEKKGVITRMFSTNILSK